MAGRVRQLFEEKGLNASSAAKALGYSVPSKLYSILQGVAAPNYSTLTDMLDKWPDLSAEWLLMGRGPMLRGTPTAGPAAKPAAGQPLAGSTGVERVLVVTVDPNGNENTSLVPVVAQAGYARQHNEAVYLQQLGHYRIPGFEQGTYRAFEVSGDSMEPTLNHRDVVIGSAVERWDLLTPGAIYVVCTVQSVLLKRIYQRITDFGGLLELHADNYSVKPYTLPVEAITELWEVRGYLSSYIPSTPDMTVERLWEIVGQLGLDKGEVRRHLADSSNDATPLTP
ncbi:hypothetical protein GKZ68_00255 [Hymenobacter sp. BRD128]|nr:hypothetical protein GKZ68_00255 [Hymenobacter sp. BRD128]